jgi:hypothetical protein
MTISKPMGFLLKPESKYFLFYINGMRPLKSKSASKAPITFHDTIRFYCQDRLTNRNTPGKKQYGCRTEEEKTNIAGRINHAAGRYYHKKWHYFDVGFK